MHLVTKEDLLGLIAVKMAPPNPADCGRMQGRGGEAAGNRRGRYVDSNPELRMPPQNARRQVRSAPASMHGRTQECYDDTADYSQFDQPSANSTFREQPRRQRYDEMDSTEYQTLPSFRERPRRQFCPSDSNAATCGQQKQCKPQKIIERRQLCAPNPCARQSPCQAQAKSPPKQPCPKQQFQSPCANPCLNSTNGENSEMYSEGEPRNSIGENMADSSYQRRLQYMTQSSTNKPVPINLEQIFLAESSNPVDEVIARNFNLDELIAREQQQAQAGNSEGRTWCSSDYSPDESSRNQMDSQYSPDISWNSSMEPSGPQFQSTARNNVPNRIVLPGYNANSQGMDTSWNSDMNASGAQYHSTWARPTEPSASPRRLNTNTYADTSYNSDMQQFAPNARSSPKRPIPSKIVFPVRGPLSRKGDNSLIQRNSNSDAFDNSYYSDMEQFQPIAQSSHKSAIPSRIVMPEHGFGAQNDEYSQFQRRPGPVMDSTQRPPLAHNIVMPRQNTTDMPTYSTYSEMNSSDPFDSISHSAVGANCSKVCNGNKKRPMPNPDDLLKQEFIRKMLLAQVNHLVKDTDCPGIIQETINGCVNFNKVAFELVFGECGCIPECPPVIEPVSLLEAFQLRSELEQLLLNNQKCCRNMRTAEEDEFGLAQIDEHFAKLNNSELNKAIAALLKADAMYEQLRTQEDDTGPSFSVVMSKGEMNMPGGNPAIATEYTGITTSNNIL